MLKSWSHFGSDKVTFEDDYTAKICFSNFSCKYICVQAGGKSRIACLRVEWHAAIAPRRRNRAKSSYRPLQRAKVFIPPASTSKMFILPAANYALARNATFSTNLDTKRLVYLERHCGDVTRVNTALATLGRLHFALVTIATMPPLVHNLLFLSWGINKQQAKKSLWYLMPFCRKKMLNFSPKTESQGGSPP